MKTKNIALAFVVSMTLTACTTTDDKKGDLLEGQLQTEKDVLVATALNNAKVSGEQVLINGLPKTELKLDAIARLGAEFTDPSNPLSKRTIYFKHDSSQIQQSFVSIIAAHAQYLLAHSGQRVILDGHTDELGSREYNIALGEQRAKSVYRMLKVQGVSGQQLEVVSYGEEKPASTGDLQLNRRVEISYQVN